MKKTLKVIGIILIVIVVVLWIALVMLGGRTIKAVVNTAGPAFMKVPVTLADAEFRPFRGLIHLQGLHVGNPEGFKSDGVFDLGGIRIQLDPGSLLTDTIHIESIRIDDPVITYDLAFGKSNLGVLLKQLESASTSDAGKPAASSGKKVIIDELIISGARLRLSSTLIGGAGAPIPLPVIVLRDIGKEKDGATIAEVIAGIVRAIVNVVTQVVTGLGGFIKDGVIMVGDAGAAALGTVGKVGSAAVGAVGAVGGAAVDAVGTVGGAAVDTASGAVKAVGEGAGNLIKGAGNLLSRPFKSDAPTNEPAHEPVE
ncbi:MAG: hypothetical protein A2340_08690 [Lentisphaerae bacterium RIFOXYB12_FULL_60_10]|nr:MAG: hypothetical protein A2340_08690 [Lentisphaerae bacterium RIFOXYB12_FULL_60_10]